MSKLDPAREAEIRAAYKSNQQNYLASGGIPRSDVWRHVGALLGIIDALRAELAAARQVTQRWVNVAREAREQRDAARTALATIPFGEYGDAQRNGCDADGAWRCFMDACRAHIAAAPAADSTPDAQ